MSSGTATPIDPSAHWWKEITRNQWYAFRLATSWYISKMTVRSI